jgi:hypothetical protein
MTKFKSNIDELRFQNSIEKRKFKTSYDAHQSESYEVVGKREESRASKLLSGLRSKKEMIILQEIIGPPKALR